MADYLQVKHTATAAFTPNANGLNERNHCIVDTMLEKMLLTDPALKPEIALMWAINAKNTLSNRSGFSPAQIVFGKNQVFPLYLLLDPQA